MSNRKMRHIRDHMDDILETRGYFRKHVARDPDSIFRAVSDVLFNTQQNKAQMLKNAYFVYLASRGKREDLGRKHDRVRRLANLLGVEFNILEASNPDIDMLKIKPRSSGRKCDDGDEVTDTFDSDDEEKDEKEERYPLLACQDCLPTAEAANSMSDDDDAECPERRRQQYQCHENSGDSVGPSPSGKGGGICSGRGSSATNRTIYLCFSGPHQYDPVYPKRTIDNAAMVQSILYEVLYSKVFNLSDALEAADFMLNGNFDSMFGKPDIYDKEFTGTAMEALQQFLIPFPYKVAKALDPELYRNIEYDVWSNDRRSGSSAGNQGESHSRSSSSGGQLQTIGTLEFGTPCLIRDFWYGDIFGFVMQPTSDRKRMEVYVPQHDCCFYVPRNMVLPIKNPPSTELVRSYRLPELSRLFRTQTSICSAEEREEIRLRQQTNIQDYNMSLSSSGDPEWVAKSDFSVPPPRFYPVGPPVTDLNLSFSSAEDLIYLQQQQHLQQLLLMQQQTPPPQSPFADPAVVYSVDQHGNFVFGNANTSTCTQFPGVQSQLPYIDASLLFAQPAQAQQRPSSVVPFWSHHTAAAVPWGVTEEMQVQQQQQPYSPLMSPPNTFPLTPIVTPFPQQCNNSGDAQQVMSVFQFPSPPTTPAQFLNSGVQAFMMGQGSFVFP